MILASYKNTMRNAVPCSLEQVKRMADQDRWIQAIDRARHAPSKSRIMKDRVHFALSRMPSWARDVIRSVADKHGVDVNSVLFTRRRGSVRNARNEVCYALRGTVSPITGRKPSFPTIGRWIGRDHTSVLQAVSNHACDTGLPALTTRDAESRRERAREAALRQKARKAQRVQA